MCEAGPFQTLLQFIGLAVLFVTLGGLFLIKFGPKVDELFSDDDKKGGR